MVLTEKDKEGPMNHFIIPDIYCPFPISLHLEQVQAHAQEWLNAIDLVPREIAHSPFLTKDVPWMICSIYPGAGLEELCLCTDWYIWGFSYDDLCDNSELGTRPYELNQTQEALLTVFQDSSPEPVQEPMTPTASSLVAALSDTWQRASQLTSSTWQRRFASHHAEYFASQRQEVANRSHQQIPDMQSYIINRRASSFSTTSMDLIELVHHIEIPVEVYESQPFQAMLNSMYDIVGWTNDVYSLPKELARGEVNNLVVVMQHEEGGTLQDAINRVCTMINRETQHFQELVQCLPPILPKWIVLCAPIWLMWATIFVLLSIMNGQVHVIKGKKRHPELDGGASNRTAGASNQTAGQACLLRQGIVPVNKPCLRSPTLRRRLFHLNL